MLVRRNITSNTDKADIETWQEEAGSRNFTRHELFRDWARGIAGRVRAWKYRALMRKLRYADAGRTFTRDEMNERR
ncbi:MAG TPA: hypothetical protein VE957_23575 [Terriglobales bacterium]|nr:hypothetical protein [Terriglobales bacterium]